MTTGSRADAVARARSSTIAFQQLAVIATIFLPLTFITGFFGQNFGWLVGHIGGWPAFVGLGIGVEIAAIVVLMTFFRRRGWF